MTPKCCSIHGWNSWPWPYLHSSTSQWAVSQRHLWLTYRLLINISAIELQVHGNALCSNLFCPYLYLVQAMMVLIVSERQNFCKGYIYLRPHKKCYALSNPLGRILRKLHCLLCALSLSQYKRWDSSFRSVLRSLTSSLGSDERATSVISCLSCRKHQLTKLCLWCSYKCIPS